MMCNFKKFSKLYFSFLEIVQIIKASLPSDVNCLGQNVMLPSILLKRGSTVQIISVNDSS